jgi:hypothetical protein
MSVTTMPEMTTPRGIVRSGSRTSWLTSEVISNPENAKHIADQTPIVFQAWPGTQAPRA